ncbi:MAG: phosphoglycerate kinase [Actinomycetota bacterium]|nr:phosphoglycerate kinase [Actinomycetota bacterium]MDD5665773.1 phosphoglycerate kinase [Actinomycetota bacterium]
MAKKTVKDVDVSGKRVLVRVDFNVPLDDAGGVADDTRIEASLPTLRYLLDHGASLVIMSHLGRPKGKVVESMRLTPVAARLGELLGVEVRKTGAVVGEEVEKACAELRPGEVILLENLRFQPGEEDNDPDFAAALARLADVYVNDAFGAAHRAHASVTGVAERLPAVAGLLMEKEVRALQGLLTAPERPFVAVLGGSKISDKLKVIGRFQNLVDTLLIGGGMCFTIFKSQGMEIGKSLCEDDLLDEVGEFMARGSEAKAEIMLPMDLVVASDFKEDADSRTVGAGDIPAGWMGLDIGPRTIEAYVEAIAGANTIFWNGPMGVFEWEAFSRGTRAVAEAMASSSAVSVAGGGDTIAAIEKYGLAEDFTHISTGGGASMELLEGRELPGVAALEDAEA